MRIAYWTTACLQPEIEAVSKEVFQLAAHFHGSFLFGVSSHYKFCASLRHRYTGFHPSFDPALRLLIPVIERFFDINHVYGDASPWTFYKSLGSKPLVITIASERGVPQLDFLARAEKIFVQTKSCYRSLQAAGIEMKRLELLYPGIDLERFQPRTQNCNPTRMPKILFATAPRSQAEMNSRGVFLLLEAAKLSKDLRLQLLYRQWNSGYTSLAATRECLETQSLKNVTLTNSVVSDMSSIYKDYDFTIIPYTVADGGKECPMSAIEGLACGLPVLISSVAPFAEFISENRCGVVFDPTPDGIVASVETGMRQYKELSANALNAAREHFSLEEYFNRMARYYQEILN